MHYLLVLCTVFFSLLFWFIFRIFFFCIRRLLTGVRVWRFTKEDIMYDILYNSQRWWWSTKQITQKSVVFDKAPLLLLLSVVWWCRRFFCVFFFAIVVIVVDSTSLYVFFLDFSITFFLLLLDVRFWSFCCCRFSACTFSLSYSKSQHKKNNRKKRMEMCLCLYNCVLG